MDNIKNQITRRNVLKLMASLPIFLQVGPKLIAQDNTQHMPLPQIYETESERFERGFAGLDEIVQVLSDLGIATAENTDNSVRNSRNLNIVLNGQKVSFNFYFTTYSNDPKGTLNWGLRVYEVDNNTNVMTGNVLKSYDLNSPTNLLASMIAEIYSDQALGMVNIPSDKMSILIPNVGYNLTQNRETFLAFKQTEVIFATQSNVIDILPDLTCSFISTADAIYSLSYLINMSNILQASNQGNIELLESQFYQSVQNASGLKNERFTLLFPLLKENVSINLDQISSATGFQPNATFKIELGNGTSLIVSPASEQNRGAIVVIDALGTVEGFTVGENAYLQRYLSGNTDDSIGALAYSEVEGGELYIYGSKD